MASLRLTFPEKDQPTVIALTGARLTIGRLPFNTIQIIDRTISGFHAELINEHGHYRLHDRGSSNGTYVNGQRVSDYHLSEACTIGFGTVEAQFSPEEIASNEEAETFPSRGEVNAVRQENAEMRATVAALREEIEALRGAHASSSGSETVLREDYDKMVVEREALKEMRLRNEEEINRLKTDLAILKRDRLNLQLAYDGSQREVEQLRRKLNGGEEETALRPVEAATVVAALADEIRIEVPKPAASAAPVAVPAEPLAPSAPFVPPTPSAPPEESVKTEVPTPAETPAPEVVEPATIIAPAASLPRPVAVPASPSAPAPKASPVLQKPSRPSVPSIPADLPRKTVPLPPMAAGIPDTIFTRAPKNGGESGVQPAPRLVTPPGAVPAGGPPSGVKPNLSTTKLQRPLPPPRQIPLPAKKLTPPPKPGPKGTQRLTD